MSVKTLRKEFDKLYKKENLSNKNTASYPVNLILDATFFGRKYGFLCFLNAETSKIIYYKEIVSENIASLNYCLDILISKGYSFKSFTLDGKRGFINLLKQRFSNTPIQMCLFHQKAIIRRYITNNPQSICGIELKELMKNIKSLNCYEFVEELYSLQEKYKEFLLERNQHNEFKHNRLRSAFRSLRTNLPYLFSCKEHSELNIPSTSNKVENLFSHLKEKIKIHRGLSEKRKKQAIRFLLDEKS